VGTEFRQIWAEQTGRQQGKSAQQFVGDLRKDKGILLGRWAEVAEIGDWPSSSPQIALVILPVQRYRSTVASASTRDNKIALSTERKRKDLARRGAA
jgi:hypothetical protein